MIRWSQKLGVEGNQNTNDVTAGKIPSHHKHHTRVCPCPRLCRTTPPGQGENNRETKVTGPMHNDEVWYLESLDVASLPEPILATMTPPTPFSIVPRQILLDHLQLVVGKPQRSGDVSLPPAILPLQALDKPPPARHLEVTHVPEPRRIYALRPGPAQRKRHQLLPRRLRADPRQHVIHFNHFGIRPGQRQQQRRRYPRPVPARYHTCQHPQNNTEMQKTTHHYNAPAPPPPPP